MPSPFTIYHAYGHISALSLMLKSKCYANSRYNVSHAHHVCLVCWNTNIYNLMLKDEAKDEGNVINCAER